MPKIHLFLLSALIPLVLPFAYAADLTLSSPDGHLKFTLSTSSNRMTWSLSHKTIPILEPGELALALDSTNLITGARLAATVETNFSETYPYRGIHSRATNHYHGATLSLLHPATPWTLEIRVFNDGAAFRHIIPPADKPRIPDESTSFILPSTATLWHHDLGGHYEDTHKKSAPAQIPPDDWLAPPVTFKLTSGAYASITEAALLNYSGMSLQSAGDRKLVLGLGHKHPISYPFRLRYSNDIDHVSKPFALTGPVISPWRVIIVAPDLNTLVNSDLISNLAPPPDPDLFPHGLNTPWIKPGRAVWKYLDGGANTFENMKDFSRWAGELGFEHHVIEGFWSRWSDEQLRELTAYSRERGVGIWCWRHSRELRTPDSQEAFFKRLADAGVVGAKIDFFDHEHGEVTGLYTQLLQRAARHKIMVNFHGANKPSGETRTWPNELIREGVRGMESSRLLERARHNTILPFTRFLAGPADYTPVHFGSRRGDTTWAHQIATAAIFNEPLLTYAAHPTNLLQNPALPMIRSIPAVWDETRVLPPSEIGEIAIFARRTGKQWFLAVLNGPDPRDLKISLSFLPSAQYDSLEVLDHEDNAASLHLSETRKTARDSITLKLRSGGGYIARFTPR